MDTDLQAAIPDDVLGLLVRKTLEQPRRPAAGLSLTATCSGLHKLCPEDVAKECAKDAVAHSLDSRPSTQDLQRVGIIKGAPGTSVSLINTQQALRKELLRSGVARGLVRRHSAPELEQRGILRKGVSARLSATRESLQRERAKDTVSQTLEARPSVEELQTRGILRGEDEAASAASRHSVC